VGCPIFDIIKVIDIFPTSIIEEMNESLSVEILEGEILSTLSTLQKSKN